jgi:two-component system sensor histidine kinase ChvG
MTGALYDRIDAIEMFAADVAHEIKNPLTSLRSAVETLRLAKDDAARERLLKVIEKDVHRLDRLVTDISNASRLDAELVREEMEAFDICELVANLVEFNQYKAADKNRAIRAILPEKPIKIHGLETRIAQVIVNLIANAISFTPENGEIEVAVRKSGADKVRVTVVDHGPGIPDENLGSVFERFYSERPDHEEFGNHSGLGLAISRQIVDAHGGRIWAENVRPAGAGPETPPEGARFVLELPL